MSYPIFFKAQDQECDAYIPDRLCDAVNLLDCVQYIAINGVKYNYCQSPCIKRRSQPHVYSTGRNEGIEDKACMDSRSN